MLYKEGYQNETWFRKTDGMENRDDSILVPLCGKSWKYVPHDNAYTIHMYAYFIISAKFQFYKTLFYLIKK